MAETIVMIHGMYGGSWYWENYKNFLEQRGFRCHTPTLRYHDMDPNDKPDLRLGTTSLLDYARDLEEYIHNLDQKPFLMGHSMGGLLAQILGARGLAKGLVLLTPASPSGINALKYSVIKSFWLLDFKGGSKVDQSNVSCPVLVVAGTEDRITPASVVRKVANKYDAVSTYKEFENHAHWVIAEPGWEEIAEFASDWLNQISN